METDVIIVGAGPAGSTAAKILVEKGIDVVLIDKNRFPRDKPCGGGLPICALKRFPYIKDANIIETYSFGGCIYSPSSEYKIEIDKEEAILAMVLRKKFDAALVKLAIDSGAKFQDGKDAVNVRIQSDKAHVLLNDGSMVDADLVIGADGVLSSMARKVGLFNNSFNKGISIVEEFPLPRETMDKYYTDKRFCHIHVKIHGLDGYGWVFPKHDYVNIGLVDYRLERRNVRYKKNLKEVFNRYLSFLKNSDIIPKDISSKQLKGGILPVKPLKKTFSDRIILCGDAAGFINPVSGEGIYYAMSSAELAAQISLEAIEKNDYSRQFLSKYEQLWKHDFGRDLKLLQKLTRVWKTQDVKSFKIVSQDKKLAEMLFIIWTDQASIYDLRWKLLKRYLYASIKSSIKGK